MNRKDVEARYKVISNKYKKRQSEFSTDLNLIFFDHDGAFALPKAEEEAGEVRVMSADAWNLHNDAVSIITSLKRTVKAWSRKHTEDSDEKTSIVEKFVEGLLYVNKNRRQEDIIDRAINWACAVGWGPIFYYWDPDMEEADGKIITEVPIIIKALDPHYFFPYGRDDYGRIAEVFYAPKMLRVEAERKAGKKIRAKGSEDADEVVWMDYWYWDKQTKERDKRKLVPYETVVCDGVVIKKPTEMYHYTSIPYVPLYAYDSVFPSLEHSAHGVVYGAREAIKNKERTLSTQSTLLDLQSMGAIVIKSGRGASNAPEIHRERGGETFILPDEEIIPLIDAVPSPIASEMANAWDREIGKASFSPTPPSPGMADTLYANLAATGQLRLARVVGNLERCLAVLYTGLLDLATRKAEGKKIHVYGELRGVPFDVPINMNEISNFRVECKISKELPQDTLRKEQTGIQMLAIPPEQRTGISNRYIYEEKFGIEQPEDEYIRSMKEQADAKLFILRLQQLIKENKDEMPQWLRTLLPDGVEPPPKPQPQPQQQLASPGQPPMPGGLPPPGVMPPGQAQPMPPMGGPGGPPPPGGPPAGPGGRPFAGPQKALPMRR